jgi:putative aminopeptidase FrvX
LKREKRAAVVADAAVSLTTQANASQTDAKMVEAELREDGGIDVDVEQQCQMAEVQFTISAAVENEAAVAAVSLKHKSTRHKPVRRWWKPSREKSAALMLMMSNNVRWLKGRSQSLQQMRTKQQQQQQLRQQQRF